MSPKLEQMKFVGTNVPADLHAQFKNVADANDRSMSKELRRAMQAHVEAHANDAKANGGAA